MGMIKVQNEKEIPRRKVSLGKMLPSIITISAFCFGLTSIRFALFHKWEMAVLCVLASAILDAFDGRVARMLGQSSKFGAELDSLSDLVCFGVAPSMILFLKTMYFMDGIGWAICMFFTVCCALRLARFNAMQILDDSKPEWTKKYFIGVPAPAGAILAMFPMIAFFATEKDIFLNPALVSCCMLISGTLMISTLKNFSSKMIEIKTGIVSPELIIISLIIICMITALWQTLVVLVLFYAGLIPYGTYCYSKAAAVTAEKDASDDEAAQK